MKLLHILPTDASAPRHKAAVHLTDHERRSLRGVLGSGTAATRTLTHARILLKADASSEGPGWTDAAIAGALEVSQSTVSRVRRAFVTGGMDAALQRKPTSRQYRRALDGRQEARLVALTCGTPPAGQARWSLRLLTERFIELEGTRVSDETVRRTLKKTNSSPG